jgi:hypothetical protein
VNWAYLLVFLIGLATEWLWVLAVDAVNKRTIWMVVFTAIALPGINLIGIGEYVDDKWIAVPMLTGNALGALAVMLWKASRESRTGRPTTGPTPRSSDPS